MALVMREPTRPVSVELVIRRSRFIGYGRAATTVAAADAELSEIRTRHPDASHVVYAYLVGAPEREIGSLSDAGEPRGTAGRPVMEILRGSEVRNAVVAVVRYFGGTKLGTGGLVHAYGDTARAVLDAFPTRPLVPRDQLRLDVDYPLHDAVTRLLAELGADLTAEQYGTTVAMSFEVDHALRAELETRLADLSAGALAVRPTDEESTE
jgi:uncharacterized YigZ family protein